MSKRAKSKPVCAGCNSNDALYVTLANGDRLPSYSMVIGVGIFCPACNDKRKSERARA